MAFHLLSRFEMQTGFCGRQYNFCLSDNFSFDNFVVRILSVKVASLSLILGPIFIICFVFLLNIAQQNHRLRRQFSSASVSDSVVSDSVVSESGTIMADFSLLAFGPEKVLV